MLNASQQGTASHPHFNFAMMTFDVAELNAAGDKYLRLSAEGYTNGTQGGTIGPTGSAEVHLVALDTSVASYFAPGSGQDWYDTHVQNPGVTVLGTYSFTNQETLYVDVTATVNAWIANGASNYGFALFSSSGAVEIASMNHADASLWPALTDVAPVPIWLACVAVCACPLTQVPMMISIVMECRISSSIFQDQIPSRQPPSFFLN